MLYYKPLREENKHDSRGTTILCNVIKLMDSNSTQAGRRCNKADILPFIPWKTFLQWTSFLDAANQHLLVVWDSHSVY